MSQPAQARLARSAPTADADDTAGGAPDVEDISDAPDVSAPPSPTEAMRSAHVTAVLVAHNGARWLPRLVAALHAQTRPADLVLGVDTGSRDDSAGILGTELGPEAVVTVGKELGFGAAVAAGLSGVPAGAMPAEKTLDRPAVVTAMTGAVVSAGAGQTGDGGREQWLWLLHDDCLPAEDALEQLLRTATATPDVAAVGPKLLGWHDRRLLLEAGVTIARSGRRETGLDRGELDQGQHDDVRDVLAVSSAGMLVRRSSWDRLGGFDPQLPLFRDDVDFGWRARRAGERVLVAPDAVVHHVGAGSAGRRTLDAGGRRRHLLDRRSALYVLLANLPGRSLPWAYVRLTLASLLRAAGLALGKLPGAALDELAAVVGILVRPDRIVAARRARRASRVVPHAEVAGLLAHRGVQLGRTLDALTGLFSRSSPAAADLASRGHRSVESGPTDDDLEDLEPVGVRWLRSLATPGVLLTVALTVLALVAGRHLLGAGRLMDGALLPAPDGARDLWRTYAGTWHDVGLGSDATAPPYLAVIALVASVLLGKAPLAVDLLLLGAVPLAGLTAWFASRGLLRSRATRSWAAATYALLPATTGAIAGGRLGTTTAVVLLPLVLSGAARALGADQQAARATYEGEPSDGMAVAAPAERVAEASPDEDDGGRLDRTGGRWPAAWATGLLLAATVACVPAAYAIALAALLVVGLAGVRGVAGWARLLVIALVPPAVLVPWSIELASDPGRLFLEAGLPGPGLSDPSLPPSWLLLQSSGGPGSIPWWLGVPLVLGALAGLLSRHRRGAVLAGWIIAAAGLAVGVVVSSAAVSTATSPAPSAGWPGFPVAVVATGLLVATAVGAESSRGRLTQRAFGWRQPMALAVAVLAAIAPLLFAGWWVVRGADDPVSRRDEVVLPEFLAAEGDEPSRPRTIVLRAAGEGAVTYALLRGGGPRLGDAETGPPDEAYDQLDVAIADVVSGRGGEDLSVLTDHGVQYVLVAAPVDDDLAAIIDALPGVERVTTSAGDALWRLIEPTARLRLLDADGEVITLLPAEREGARTTVTAGAPGRLAVLAERADVGWTATVNGVAIPATEVGGWAQAFEVPAGGGTLVIAYDSEERGRWLLLQALLVGVVLVLALPGVRREALGA